MRTRLAAVIVALLCATVRAEAAIVHEGSDVGKCDGAAGLGNMSGNPCAGATGTFTYTAFGIGNGVLFSVACGGNTQPTSSTLTATGWTITQVKAPAGGSQGGWLSIFKAYVPDGNAATFTLTWGGVASCGGFMNDIEDEFSGVDATDFIDNGGFTIATAANGGCPASASITPNVNDTAVWWTCLDTITAVGGGYTAGGNDSVGDWSEWKVLTGGAGVAQNPSFTTSGAYTIGAVTVKPSAGGAPLRQLLGVGQRLALFFLSRPHALWSLFRVLGTAAP